MSFLMTTVIINFERQQNTLLVRKIESLKIKKIYKHVYEFSIKHQFTSMVFIEY